MSTAFWIRRSAQVLLGAFLFIAIAQVLKGHSWSYALTQAAIWSVIATAVFTAVRIVQFRRMRQCNICPVSPQSQSQAAPPHQLGNSQ